MELQMSFSLRNNRCTLLCEITESSILCGKDIPLLCGVTDGLFSLEKQMSSPLTSLNVIECPLFGPPHITDVLTKYLHGIKYVLL
jgi:hypothetical protein